jgi:hypothetical protein
MELKVPCDLQPLIDPFPMALSYPGRNDSTETSVACVKNVHHLLHIN